MEKYLEDKRKISIFATSEH